MRKNKRSTKAKISKKVKSDIEICYSKKDYTNLTKLSLDVVKSNPDNIFGYIYLIKGLSNDYSKYLENDELKKVKETYQKAYFLANKNKKEELKSEFLEYIEDIKEVDNLNKIKRELISMELLRFMYQDKLKIINQHMNILNSYNEKGIRIKNGFDFLNALFLLICLIINLIFRNILLLFTIPLGIYSLITIYSFFETNFFSKGKLVSLKNNNYNLIKMVENKIIDLKKEINKSDELIKFIKKQKESTINKIPESFNNEIIYLINNNEEEKAKVILESLESNNILLFNSLLNENTNLSAEEISNKLKPFAFEEKIEDYVNIKSEEKKSNQSEIIIMQKIKKMDIFLLLLTILISLCSIIFIKENIISYNFIYFIISIFIGILSMIVYDINNGKHQKVFDTFLDNLLFCTFNSSLIYDILYLKDYSFRFVYIFIMVPITFMFLYMGLSMIISIIKYKHLLKRFSK